MRRLLAVLFTVALVLGTAGAITALAMTGHSGDDPNKRLDEGVPEPPCCKQVSHPGMANPGLGVPVTSIDDIDPDRCDLVHNINACTPEEIQGLMGVGSVITSVEVLGKIEPGVVGILVSANGNPEPLFVDGELVSPTPVGQPDCGDDEAGATVYLTSLGETGCVVSDADKGHVQGLSMGQPPSVDPQMLPVAE